MYRLAIFTLALCAVVFAEDQGCPEVEAVGNFRYNEYTQGEWYEFARYKSEESGTCSSSEYTPDGNIFKIKDCNVKNGKRVCRDAYGKLAPDAGNRGKLIYSGPYGPNNAMVNSLVNILATDYENYSIMYFCMYIKPIKMRKEISWVLTRSRDMSDETKAQIEKYINDSPVLDSKKFIKIDLSDDACNVN